MSESELADAKTSSTWVVISPWKQRTLLWLAYVEEYSHREIAEILEISEGSVRVLLHRARGRLRGSLEALDTTRGGRPFNG